MKNKRKKEKELPVFIWVFRFIWFVWLVIWAEMAIGSWKEFEPKAATIALAVFSCSFLLGLLLWFKGNKRRK